jgi:hypothetical protein
MFKKIIFLICIAFQSVSSAAQTPSLSLYEKRWALRHPVTALRIKKISRQLLPLYQDTLARERLDRYASGGQLDAFRHVFYMAAFAQKINVSKLRELGRAHEKANYEQFKRGGQEEGEVPDSLGSVMDLANNELGFKMGTKYKKMSLNELRSLVIQAVWEGEATILIRNAYGRYVDCNGREITAQELRRWNTPKCLDHSSIMYPMGPK